MVQTLIPFSLRGEAEAKARSLQHPQPYLMALACAIGLAVPSGPLAAQPSWLRERLQDWSVRDAPAPARAIVILHQADVTIDRRGRATTECREVVKLLRTPVEEFRRLSIPFSDHVQVTDLDGWLIKRSGSVKPLEDRAVADIGAREEVAVYDDLRYRVADFPDAEPGDIVAFEYAVREDDWTSAYQSFVFQEEQPVDEARFSVRIPDGWKINVGMWAVDSAEQTREDNRFTWTSRNLRCRPEEPMMPAWPTVARRIIVSAYDPAGGVQGGFRDWPAVARWSGATEEAGNVASEPVARKVAELTAGCTTLEAKVSAVAKFVRDDVRYVAVELGKWRWEPRPAALTLQNRYGDCKDKTALMRAMLQVLGLRTRAVLANARVGLLEDVPSPFQFNHCIVGFDPEDSALSRKYAAVALGPWIICDPTAEASGLGFLPQPLHGIFVLIADSSEHEPRRLPNPPPEADVRLTTVDALLHADGSVDADVRVTYVGKWAEYSTSWIGKVPSGEEAAEWRKRLGKAMPSPAISDLRRWAGGDSVCWAFHCKSANVLVAAGNVRLLKADLLAPDEPQELTAPVRVHPVSFGPARYEKEEITWHLPGTWKLAARVADVEASCTAGRVRASAQPDKGRLRFVKELAFSGGLVMPDRYDEAKAFERQLHAARTTALELLTK